MNNFINNSEELNKIFCTLFWILLVAIAIRGVGLIILLVMFATGAAKGAANTLESGFLKFRLAEDVLPVKEAATTQFICGLAVSIFQIIGNGAIINGYDMNSIFLNDKIVGVGYNFRIDTTFIFVALVLFLLSYVFRYGTQLQQLSDEIL